MKKRLMFIIAIFSTFLIATGCTVSNEKMLENVSKNMNKLDNYGMNIKMSMVMKSEGVEMAIPVVIDSKVDNKNKMAFLTTSVEMFGFKVTTDGYMDYTNDKETIVYTESTDEGTTWEKEVKSNNNGNESDIIGIHNIITNGTKVTKKESDDKNTLYYQISISKEEAQKLLSSNDTGELAEDVNLKDDITVDVYVDKKEKLLKKIYIDFSKFMEVTTEDVEISKFDFEVIFDQYSKVGNVEIPEDVIKNAVEVNE